MSLEERLKTVMRSRKWSEREWSQKAGLSPGAVQAILRRVRGDEEASARAETLKKLADAAHVDYSWLSTGTGQGPSGMTPTQPTAAGVAGSSMPLARDHYPNRAIALKVLGDRLHPRARDVIESMSFPDDASDLTVDEWLEQAKVWHRRALEVENDLESIEASVKSHPAAGALGLAPTLSTKRPAKS